MCETSVSPTLFYSKSSFLNLILNTTANPKTYHQLCFQTECIIDNLKMIVDQIAIFSLWGGGGEQKGSSGTLMYFL